MPKVEESQGRNVMLESILISDEEMAELPYGAAGFLAYENLCRNKLNHILARSNENDDTMDIRLSYLTNVLNAAEFYEVSGLQGLHIDISEAFDYTQARSAARKIDLEVSKLRFIAMGERKPKVLLTEAQRSKIEHLIAQLRQRIDDSSDLDDRKKSKLINKIDELSKLFGKDEKPSLQATMVVIASIFTAINQSEAAIIKLPDVINSVLEIFGHAREDANQKLLNREVQKLIEHHGVSEENEKLGEQATNDLDDEIPF